MRNWEFVIKTQHMILLLRNFPYVHHKKKHKNVHRNLFKTSIEFFRYLIEMLLDKSLKVQSFHLSWTVFIRELSVKPPGAT